MSTFSEFVNFVEYYKGKHNFFLIFTKTSLAKYEVYFFQADYSDHSW